VLVVGVLAGFDTAARQTFFPRLVPRDRLERAVTANFTSTRLGMLAGPALGGVALASPLGATAVFAMGAAGSLAMLAAAAVLRESPLTKPPARRLALARDVLAGFGFALGAPVLRALLLFTTVWTVLGQNNALLAIFAEDVLRVGPSALGLLVSAMTAGQLAGGSLLIWWGDVARRGRLVLVTGAAYAFVMLAFTGVSTLPLTVLFVSCAGVLAAIGLASGHAVLQREAPEDMRGRVMSIQLMLARGGIPLSWAVTGSLAGWLGPQLALALSAVAVLVAAACTAALGHSLWAYGAGTAQTPKPHRLPSLSMRKRG
jgi:MFS family permease